MDGLRVSSQLSYIGESGITFVTAVGSLTYKTQVNRYSAYLLNQNNLI